MRKLRICEHISLDGVIQHSPDENGFPHADWTAPYRTAAGRDALLAAHGTSYDLLLGRRTYDLWSTFWPQAPSSPWSDGINAATKYVATHRPDTLQWGPHQALAPETAAEDLHRIKTDTDGPDLVLWGSATLAGVVLAHGLADELLLIVYPVVIGVGKRLFGDGMPPRSLDLLDTRSTPTGVVVNTYAFAGPLKKA